MSEPGPRCAQRKPYLYDLEPGIYLWCSCGLSAKQPFCDGSHRGGPFRPIPFPVTKRTRTLWLCGCKRSRTAPHCDGTHNRLPPE